MNNIIKKNSKWMVLFCFWILCVILTLGALYFKNHGDWFSIQRKDTDGRYALKMLNFYRPDHYIEFIDALKQGQRVPNNYLKYYELAVEFMPNDFASHYLLAVAQHSVSDLKGAMDNYQKAIERNPYFFWSYYNLATLYYQTGQVQEAVRILAVGLQIDPQLTLKALVSTKLLTDYLSDSLLIGYDPLDSLRKGYTNTQFSEPSFMVRKIIAF